MKEMESALHCHYVADSIVHRIPVVVAGDLLLVSIERFSAFTNGSYLPHLYIVWTTIPPISRDFLLLLLLYHVLADQLGVLIQVIRVFVAQRRQPPRFCIV